MGWGVDAIQNRFRYYSDKLKPQFRYRWMATFVLVCFYAYRVYLHGYILITFILGMNLSSLVVLLLMSCIDRDNPDRLSPPLLSDAPPPILLPIKASDELRPFVPLLPEFSFWRAVNFVLCLALWMTFIPVIPNPPARCWYILFVFWLIFTMHVLSNHRETMIKHKYIPFYYGDKKRGEYKGK